MLYVNKIIQYSHFPPFASTHSPVLKRRTLIRFHKDISGLNKKGRKEIWKNATEPLHRPQEALLEERRKIIEKGK